VDSHVRIWAQALQSVPIELKSADHIGSTLQHSIAPVYWSEINKLLEMIQKPNFPIPNLLDTVKMYVQIK